MKKVLYAMIFVVSVFSATAQALDDDVEVDTLVTRIKSLLDADKYAEALPVFEKLEDLKGSLPERLDYYYIDTLDKSGRAEKALERSEAYLKKYGKSGKYYPQVVALVGRVPPEVEKVRAMP